MKSVLPLIRKPTNLGGFCFKEAISIPLPCQSNNREENWVKPFIYKGFFGGGLGGLAV